MQKHASKYRLEVGDISDEALQALQHYDWPGNIRELGHVIERAMFLRTDTTIELKDIAIPKSTSLTNKNQPSEEDSAHQFDTLTLEEIEKQIIKSRLAAFDYHPQTTADSLGLSRSAYYRRLEKYKLA
jgi:DNA-binding NtrC family response regulator